MIEFEITKSTDLDVIGNFKFFKNEIYLGHKAIDLSINDKLISENHIFIEIPENELFIHPLPGVEYFLLNGKRSTSIKKIKKNDEIQIGNTVIKILNFELTKKISKKEILTTKMNSLIEENSVLLIPIEKLTQMMK